MEDIIEEIRDTFIKYDVKEMPYQKHLNSIASSIKGDSLIKIYEYDVLLQEEIYVDEVVLQWQI